MPLTSLYTDKKENQIFLIYKEIQSGAVAKSYMTDGLLNMGKYLRISSYIRKPFLVYDFYFIFYQCTVSLILEDCTYLIEKTGDQENLLPL
jgi:hypothetical protein